MVQSPWPVWVGSGGGVAAKGVKMWGYELPEYGRGSWHFFETELVLRLYSRVPAVCGADHKLCRWVNTITDVPPFDGSHGDGKASSLICPRCFKLSRKYEKPPKTWIVYGLLCPLTFTIRYIGVTSQSLETRWAQHLHEADAGSCTREKQRWFNELHEKIECPVAVVLETYSDEDAALSAERYWIENAPSAARLVNVTHNTPSRVLPKQSFSRVRR